MTHPFKVVSDFEQAVADYCGAPYCIAVNSCTMALFLAMMRVGVKGKEVHMPAKTYISVPMQVMHAGGKPVFDYEDWRGCYQLKPFNIWDSARWFTKGLFQKIAGPVTKESVYVCVSFHASKTLSIEQGGAILHNDAMGHAWFKKARFDGRQPGIAPREDKFKELGWHCYMSPSVAAIGLLKLYSLPKDNFPLPNDNYPDLSQLELFRADSGPADQ